MVTFLLGIRERERGQSFESETTGGLMHFDDEVAAGVLPE